MPANHPPTEANPPAVPLVESEVAAPLGAFRRMMRDENGQAMVEYVIMIGFLIVTAIIVDQLFTEIIKDQAESYLLAIMDP